MLAGASVVTSQGTVKKLKACVCVCLPSLRNIPSIIVLLGVNISGIGRGLLSSRNTGFLHAASPALPDQHSTHTRHPLYSANGLRPKLMKFWAWIFSLACKRLHGSFMGHVFGINVTHVLS